jgi:ferredoxin
MKVTVDEDKCCGFAACLSIAPDMFDMDSQNVAFVLQNDPADDQFEAIRSAASACPTSAILIEE